MVPNLANYTTNKYLFSSKRDKEKEVVILKLLLEIDNKQYKLDYYKLYSEKPDFLLFWDKLNKEQSSINSYRLKKKKFLRNINKYRKSPRLNLKNYWLIENLGLVNSSAWKNIIDYCRNLKMILNSSSLKPVSSCTGYLASKHILDIINYMDDKNVIDYEDLFLLETILLCKNFSTIRLYIEDKIIDKRLENWVETWDCYSEKRYLELIKKGKCTGCVCDLPEFYDVKYWGEDLSHHLSKKFLINCLINTSTWKLKDDLRNYVKERLWPRLAPYLEREVNLSLSNRSKKKNDTNPSFSKHTENYDNTKPFFSNSTQKKDKTSHFFINPTEKDDDNKPFFSNRKQKK